MRLAKELPVGITQCPVTFNQDVKALTPKNGIRPLYLAYALKGQERRAMNWASKTTHGTLRLTTPQLKEIPIPVPPPKEQARIAEILSTWDRAIEQVNALIEQKQERLHGLRQRLLTGAERFPEFDEPWVDVEIGSLLKRVYRYVDWDDDATYNLVSIKRESQGMVFRESLKGSEIKTKTLNTLKEGDFVISRMQVVHGATAYVSEEFDGMHASDSYIILVPRDEGRIDTEFFAALSKLPYLYHIAFTSSYGVHIEKMTFNPEWYFESEVHIPPTVEEQRKIVSFLNTAKAEIDKLKRRRDALKRQKKGLMQRLLTGAVRTI
jgi:type I restriction enzyme S subunit